MKHWIVIYDEDYCGECGGGAQYDLIRADNLRSANEHAEVIVQARFEDSYERTAEYMVFQVGDVLKGAVKVYDRWIFNA